jgi:23S rRNA pseudouridine2605 synthase
MPRDNDKDNASRGPRDRPQRDKRGPNRAGSSRPGSSRPGSSKPGSGKRGFGEGRAAAHGAEKKFAKRGFGSKGSDKGGDERDRPRSRDDREQRPFRRRDDHDGPRREGDRPRGARFDRDERRTGGFQNRGEGRGRDFDRHGRDRGDEKPWQTKPFQKRPFQKRPFEKKPFEKKPFEKKPWRKREDDRRDDRGGDDRPRFSRGREERRGEERSFRERPKFDRPRERREDRPKFDRPKFDRPKFDHPRERHEGRSDWQEHPRSDKRARDRFADRPRRDNEDDSEIFAKRPAFGGRGAYRERKPERDRRAPREEARPKKTGERIAKVLARAGLASRRDAEEWVVQGRVTVNGRVINSPALDVTGNDVIAVDGKPLAPRERTRLFLYHKPRGLMTTHADPEGRPTVFERLPEGLPRLISIGRLDFNTEGLLLLTNDGGLARVLELPDTGWLRRYRVRAHGEVTQAQLDELRNGIEVEGVKYGPIDATLERDQGSNVWLVFAIREGKNREVRNVMSHLGLEVNRLIRVSYGPFQLGELGEGEAEEVKTRVLQEQLGERVIAQAGADFALAEPRRGGDESEAPRGKKPFKPSGRSALVADRKGRRVLVQRSGGAEARARNEDEASGYGPPRRPKRGYHGKRDFRPKDE